MKLNYSTIFVPIILSASIGVMIGAILFSTNTISTQIIEIDNNPELELRLQDEIDSNQELSQMVEDIIIACNEKLLDKYNSTNEKLERENEILQKALSKFRET